MMNAVLDVFFYSSHKRLLIETPCFSEISPSFELGNYDIGWISQRRTPAKGDDFLLDVKGSFVNTLKLNSPFPFRKGGPLWTEVTVRTENWDFTPFPSTCICGAIMLLWLGLQNTRGGIRRFIIYALWKESVHVFPNCIRNI